MGTRKHHIHRDVYKLHAPCTVCWKARVLPPLPILALTRGGLVVMIINQRSLCKALSIGDQLSARNFPG